MTALDIRTLVLTSALIAGALAGLSFAFSRGRSAPALRIWGWGLMALTAGLLVHASRGAGLPEILAVVVGNGLLFAALLAVHRSVAHVTGRATDDPLDVHIAIVGLVGLAVLYFTMADLRPRGALFSIVALVLLARTALALQLGSARGQMSGRTLTLLVLYGWAGAHLLRAVYLSASPPWEVFLATNALNAATFVSTALFAVAATLGIAVMQWTTALALTEPAEAAPRRDDVAPPAPVPVPRRADPPAGNEGLRGSVFLVDDNPEFVSVTAYALELAGYRVFTARSADDAARAILLRRAKPDAVVTDVVMPGRLSGIGLALELRADYPWMAVILVTGYPRSVESSDARDFAVVQKPFPLEQLVRIIESERGRLAHLKAGEAAARSKGERRPPSARAGDR